MIKRLVIAALALILSAAPAAAQFIPCPKVSVGWGVQYPPPITAVLYDQSTLLLTVVFNYTIASMYSGVPVTVMQTFSQTSNPTQIYNSIVVPQYHALLLEEKTNCPILFENGAYIWTD